MAVLDDAVVGRIQTSAAQMHPGRTLLTLIAALFFALGWLVAKLARGVWLVLSWTIAAVRVGWQEGFQAPDPRT
jgi:hypothetical protein